MPIATQKMKSVKSVIYEMFACCSLFTFAAIFLRISNVSASITYCVMPKSPNMMYNDGFEHPSRGDRVPGTNCSENKTWNEYLADQSHYFNDVSDVTFYFYPGTHLMNRSLESQRSNNILITGDSPEYVKLTSESNQSLSMTFSDYSNVALAGMYINLCQPGSIVTNAKDSLCQPYGMVRFTKGNNAAMFDSVLLCDCLGINIYAEEIHNIAYRHINVTQNGEFLAFRNISGHVQISESHFHVLKLIATTTSFLAWTFYDAKFVVENSSFYNNTRLSNIILWNNSTLVMSNILAINMSFAFHLEKQEYDYSNKPMLSIINTTFVDSDCILQRSAKYFTPSVIISDSNFTGTQKVTLISIKITSVTLESCSVTKNSGQILSIEHSRVTIKDCNFTDNNGNVLVLQSGFITFLGSTNFIGNKGVSGAAILMDTMSQLIYTNGTVLFKSNKVSETGGAIYIQGQPITCPFVPSPEKVGLIFRNNYAISGGDDVYGGNLDLVMNDTKHCIQELKDSSELPDDMSSISSSPSRVCLCTSDGKPDCLKLFHSTSVYPGESVQLSAVAVGQNFGTASGFVNAQLIDLSQSQEKYQSVLGHNCNNLTYTINSAPGIAPIALTTTIAEFDDLIMNSDEANKVINEYKRENKSYVPKALLNSPAIISVTMKECPFGFKLYSLPTRCDCFDRLKHLPGVSCQISKRKLTRSGNVWIGSNSNSSTNDISAHLLFTKYCVYCNTSKVNIFNESFDVQCKWNRSGRLCGECPNGMSLTLGTSHCKHCSNKYLSLLLLFALAGILLVVFLKLTNLTTAGGLVNGLVLYANLVKAGYYVYFTSSTFLTPFRVFIDWLNLDFGIEVCFFDGLDGYWKTWLQFVFPLYLWIISLTMILLARYSFRMSRLLGNNSVPVLATLFTLSYAKIFRVIVIGFGFTTLEYVNGTKLYVWAYDGNLEYLGTKHSILLAVVFVFVLLIGFPYTGALIFAQCLQRCQVRCISKLVFKIQPLIDAHCGPFRNNYRYWFGLLLVARAVPLIMGSKTDKEAVLATAIVVGVLFLLLLASRSWVYKKVYISLSESTFLLNLFILSLLSWGISDDKIQAIITAIFVGISFFHFLVIITFSVAGERIGKHYQKYIKLESSNNIDDISYRR